MEILLPPNLNEQQPPSEMVDHPLAMPSGRPLYGKVEFATCGNQPIRNGLSENRLNQRRLKLLSGRKMNIT